jgi:hypothetical protein
MFPWGRLVVTALHLTEGHHDVASTDHADGLEEAFHGHHHDDDATPHDHPLVKCDFSAQRSRTLEGVVLPATLPALSAMILAPHVPALVPSRPIGALNHGPPRALSPAILRI